MSGDEGGSEGRIRVRAYHLWEAAGRPEGRDEEFWARARELEPDEGEGDGGQEAASPSAPVPDPAAPA